MLSSDTRAVANRYWAADVGCTPEQFDRSALIVALPSDPTFGGVFVFVQKSFTHINAPDDLQDQIRQAAAQPECDPLDADWWQSVLGDRLLRAVGPAYVGYADTTFAPVKSKTARLLTQTDEGALQRFEIAVGPQAWEHSGLEQPQPRVACWADQQLAAVAGYHIWGERIAHIGVAVDPARRGQGYGKAVVSAIGQSAQSQGLVLQYRTLWSNIPSIAIAAALGFEHYATTLAVRLRNP